ncbi:GLPGLI family protein [Psychroflexus lacisalsi]|uniref:GLPGLI family protein n=1 Tax=Psychroflexus lacisalsi TaxID=503928 RepID=A0ABN1K3I0_9FLAO|nr:GLPGLI family protein [Psychroflexus lacisalsi]MBZ9618773.1 GLPGLI family protein [Psychroflexus lacisalsi]
MKFFVIIIYLTSLNVLPQTGIVNYGEVQSMEMGAPIGPDYRAMLVFNKDNSLYVTRKDSLEGGHIREQKSYRASSNRGFTITVVTNPIGFQYYYKTKENTLFSRDLGFDYVKDNTIDIPWDITEETKMIGIYKVQKATAHFRGRDYTAWFTSQIPLPYGPWKLVGLPGLILEAYDTDKEIYWYFKNIEYPTKQAYLLKPIDNPNASWISFQDYKKNRIEKSLDAKAAGRMIAENIGSSKSNSKLKKLDGYIEAFIVEE